MANIFERDIKGSPIIEVGSLLLISLSKLIPNPSDLMPPTQLREFSFFR